jgi:hypothetical protein
MNEPATRPFLVCIHDGLRLQERFQSIREAPLRPQAVGSQSFIGEAQWEPGGRHGSKKDRDDYEEVAGIVRRVRGIRSLLI